MIYWPIIQYTEKQGQWQFFVGIFLSADEQEKGSVLKPTPHLGGAGFSMKK